MICLHIISHILDLDTLFANIDDRPIINLVLLAVLPFLGGLAGFFLLTSAISNMVSMYKLLQKGESAQNLIIKQVMGGFLLLIFAMLCEGTIGYLGAFGSFVGDLGGTYRFSSYVATMLSRWNHFEAIHTIAWCVIINGLIQGILSRNGQWKNTARLIRIYIIIAIVMVVLTVPVWMGLSSLPFAQGYPWTVISIPSGGTYNIYRPPIGTADWWYILISPVLAMMAAPMEPLFPYLAVSCVGSIIGIIMNQPKELIPKNFVKKLLKISLVIFVIGLIGVVFTVISVMDQAGFDMAVGLYQQIPYHRHWFPDNIESDYAHYLNYFSWLWQFMALNGFGIIFTMLVIYLVEFRGIGAKFANIKMVRFVRRFGFTAFTNYNNQWYFYIVWIIVSLIFTGQRKVDLLWEGTLTVLVLSILLYHGIMLLWEKVGYIGSIEWMIGTIGMAIIPVKKNTVNADKKWWQKAKLDVQGAFYSPEWMDVITPDDAYHAEKRDSQIVEKIAKISLASVLFFPFTVFTLIMAIDAKKVEGDNPHVRKALKISQIGTIITIIFLIFCFIATPTLLGFSLQ
jgi:hypothetical protein